MRFRAQSIVWAMLLCLLGASSALADKRVALVIGNSAYQHATKLANPANDAAAVTEMFRRAQFEVVESKRDLNNADMRRTLRDFADKSRDADMAVVYYAGHGIEIEGQNYLLPVDAELARDTDAYDEAITLDRVLQVIEPAKKLRLVILDACRDNPFARTMKRTVATRTLGRGLAGVEPGKPNTLIAFAAKGGSTAEDGSTANSPFTTALIKHLTTPGLDLRKAFGLIRDDVIKATNHRQEPFVYGSLGGSDVSLVPAAPVAPPASVSQPAANPQAEIRRDYELALQLNNRQAWEFFLQQYPGGFYANLARVQLEKIGAEEAQRSASDKAKQAKTIAPASNAVTAPAADRPAEVAALPPEGKTTLSQAEINRALQAELRRVGCQASAAGDDWSAAARRSLEQFNRHAKTKFDVKLASLDALDAVKGKQARICPLVCEHGFRASGETCEKVVCRAGHVIGDDNTCEKVAPRKPAAPVAKREAPAQPAAAASSAGQNGQLAKGCRRVGIVSGGGATTVMCD